MDNRLVTGDKLKEDGFESSIRPQTIDEYIGQKDIKENIKIFMFETGTKNNLKLAKLFFLTATK